jgi:hypothetical protein
MASSSLHFYYRPLLLLLWGAFVVPSASLGQSNSFAAARELVKVAMKNQLRNDQDTAHFRYYERRTGQKGSRTYELIESDAGTVEWLVAQNDRPLTEPQRRRESAWLARVLANHDIMRKAQQEDRLEAERRQKIIRVLPQAFLYQIEEKEDLGRKIRLHFSANPAFKPASREAQICRGLQGALWIDTQNGIFLKAEGKLVRNVNFGWGFLGYLDAGGYFSLEQTEVSPGVWRITTIKVILTGSKLLFKSINIRVNEQASGFRRVPDHLTLENAVAMLRARAGSDTIH